MLLSLPMALGAIAQQEAPGGDIEFVNTTHDFGDVIDVETYSASFPFMNSGMGVLTIQEVKASCGGTTLALDKKVFAPGEASEIKVSFKPKGGGKQSKRITVFTNDSQEPILILTIEADVTQFITSSPRFIRFQDAQKGQSKQQVVTLASMDPELEVDRVYFSGQAARFFSAKVLPRQEGQPIQLLVTLEPTASWGSHYGTLNIVGRGHTAPGVEQVVHTAKVTTSAKVSGLLQSSASMFQVSIVEPGARFTKIVKLSRPDGKPFQVLSTGITGSTVADMTIKAVPIDPANGGGYSLVLTGTPERSEQSIRGTVMIYTDVPGEEELSLRIGGIARTGGPVRP